NYGLFLITKGVDRDLLVWNRDIFLGYSLTWSGEWYIFLMITDRRSVGGVILSSVAKIVGAVDISTEGFCT
ncbi:MAG: hypothetical protein ACLFST_15800, partial [Spirochaetia bacterium]